MLSYQHAYHAGGPADVHKHFVLAELLTLLTRKNRGITYLETHAGRGLYDLTSEESQKTGEAKEGIEQLALSADTALGSVLEALWAERGPAAYPGSPMVAARSLRAQDRIILMEKHPREIAGLKRAMRGTGAEIHQRDGYEGALAVSPPRPRRGLIVIDPSYEVKSEYETAAEQALKLRRKWPEASVLIWYPILRARRHDALKESLGAADPMISEVHFDLKGGAGMTGSGLLLLNPPFGAEALLGRMVEATAPLLRPVFSP